MSPHLGVVVTEPPRQNPFTEHTSCAAGQTFLSEFAYRNKKPLRLWQSEGARTGADCEKPTSLCAHLRPVGNRAAV